MYLMKGINIIRLKEREAGDSLFAFFFFLLVCFECKNRYAITLCGPLIKSFISLLQLVKNYL